LDRFDVVIVGAGPAGMMTAITAAERNKRVLLLERTNALGKKLRISGKGRCNLTNSCDVAEFLKKFSGSRNFLRNAFAKFFNDELRSFFENSHLKLKTERGGRVFPQSDKSADVLNVLKTKLKNRNMSIVFKERGKKVLVRNAVIEGVLTATNKSFKAQKVVIATGGVSYPLTGSSGDGYKMADALGHEVMPLRPALVGVRIKEKWINDWQGIALKHVGLTVWAGAKKIDDRFGEMLFTHFGISGPIVLDMSAGVDDALKLEKAVTVGINLKPALDQKKLDARLLREFGAAPKRNVKSIFKSLLPQNMIDAFLQYCSLDGERKASQVTAKERKSLIKGLFDLRLTVAGVMPIKDAIVTRGGVNTKEINPQTMESKFIPGLYFVGEVIDVDAKTGGYNMQAAFSTGWVCGNGL